MDDEARLERWDELTSAHKDQCVHWLEQALRVSDVGALHQLFAQQGFKLGQMAQAVHLKILKAYLHGETTLDHVRAFFTQLGGGFFTNASQTMCIWNELAWLEARETIHPTTLDEFLQNFDKMYTLVRCLVDECHMPVNPAQTFGNGERARVLPMTRGHSAWFLYYVLALYSQHDNSIRQVTLEDLQRDPYTTPEMLHFWRESRLLIGNNGPIEHDVNQLAGLLGEARLHQPPY